MNATGYVIPQIRTAPKLGKKQILLVANGDLRQTANQKCWLAQAEMEETLRNALAGAGYELVRRILTRKRKDMGSSVPRRREWPSLRRWTRKRR